jgi:hypothetical protein
MRSLCTAAGGWRKPTNRRSMHLPQRCLPKFVRRLRHDGAGKPCRWAPVVTGAVGERGDKGRIVNIES